MSLELVGYNSIVVAHQFNPSVVGQLWLVRNGILDEADFEPGCAFTDVAVHVNAKDFNLLIVLQQCQFTPHVAAESAGGLVTDKVGTIVRCLPHTPYRAVGLNFTWHLAPEQWDVPSISRKLFFVDERSPYTDFDVEDARFGAYMSKDALGGRLRLNIQPINTKAENQDVERIQFAFNLHRDVARDDNPAKSWIDGGAFEKAPYNLCMVLSRPYLRASDSMTNAGYPTRIWPGSWPQVTMTLQRRMPP